MELRFSNPPSYREYSKYMGALKGCFDTLKTFEIGRTRSGFGIRCIHAGSPDRLSLYVAGLQPCAWESTLLLLHFAYLLLRSEQTGEPLAQMDTRQVLARKGVLLVPALALDGMEEQFGAFASGSASPGQLALIGRCCSDAHGRLCLCRGPENDALTSLCARLPIQKLVVFSSSGNTVSYRFQGKEPPSSHLTARLLASSGGLRVSRRQNQPGQEDCKDWFIERFSRPGFLLSPDITAVSKSVPSLLEMLMLGILL